MPGSHVRTIERFIDRLNQAVSRSALLKVAIRSGGGRMLDISSLAELDRDAPAEVLRAFVAAAGAGGAEGRKAAKIDFAPRPSPSKTAEDDDDDDVDDDEEDHLLPGFRRGDDEPTKPSAPSRLEGLATSIRRSADLAKRETGVHALWFGWPLLHVSSSEEPDAQSVLAPLFLFAASITPHARRHSVMTIARDDAIGPPRWNSVLGAWLEQKLGISIEPPDEADLAEWDGEQFLAWIDRSFAAFPTPPTLAMSRDPVRIPLLSKMEPSLAPRLLHAGALGLYRWQNAAILADLCAMKELGECPEPLGSFIDGRALPDPAAAPPREADRFLVTDADFSQADVVWKCRNTEGLVVHGPPGTGKSQTIVNVIADSLARGERVLMVSQKDAATRVVHNRLRQAGLGSLCLEVHDAENDRMAVFRSIRDQVDALPERPATPPRDRERLASEIEALEQSLDEFAIGMRQVDPSVGLCYRDLLTLEGRCLQRFPAARGLSSLPNGIAALDHDAAQSLASAIRRLGTLCHEARVPLNPWSGRIRDAEHRPGFRRDAEQALDSLRGAAASLDEAVGEVRGRTRQRPVPTIEGDPREWRRRLETLLDGCRLLARRSSDDREAIRGWIDAMESRSPADGTAPLFSSLAEAMKAVAASDELPRDPGWDAALANSPGEGARVALDACRRVTASTQQSWLRRWLSRSLKEAKQALRALRPETPPAMLLEVARSGVRHFEALVREAAVLEAAASCPPTLGRRLERCADAKALLRRVQATAEPSQSLLEDARRAPLLRGLIDQALRGIPPSGDDEAMVAVHARRAEALATCLAATEELRSFFHAEVVARLAQDAREGGDVLGWARLALEDLERLEPLAAWEAELESADPSWRPLIDQLVGWGLPQRSEVGSEAWGERWEVQFLVSMTAKWRSRLLAKHRILVKVTPTQHEQMTRELAELLRRKRHTEARAILAGWSARQLRARHACAWDASFKLRASKNGPSPRLREAVAASVTKGLLDMRPCWITNPSAVAEIFPRLEGLFDLVIFDEASQCPTEQAVPTMFRGKRVLIAGDQKQLPPTSFFSSSSEHEPEEDLDAEAADEPVSRKVESALTRLRSESVGQSNDLLEAAVSVLPQTYLRVHYRSEDPALIQFSNHAFYGGLLEAPPTARPRDSAASIVFKDAGGTYHDRTNSIEARLVVDEIAALITSTQPPTIGVVTFNQPQRELIEDLLETRQEQDPVFREAFQREKSRMDQDLDVGLFIKNLESVQGDERDVMIFSTTFGRDEGRRFFRRFGPVGQLGGERRLNVAVTRAKRRVIVLSSMPIAEVATVLADLGGSGDLAPPAYLQLYLEYARSVSLRDRAQVDRVLGRLGRRRGDRTLEGPDSPFEEEVLRALQRLGIEAEPQVGDGGFRIDIAVPHRDPSRGYALAIECDGAAYHSDRSARIRDVWRQEILERRGWRFHRIWSRSWWDNQAREIDRLASAVQEALDAS